MLEAVMLGPGKIDIREVPIPDVGPGKVRIKVGSFGICGSDIHVFHGKHPFTSYPIIQGHEFSGTIDAVGEGVSSLRLGDRVTVEPSIVCGKCYQCRSGRYNICDNLKVMGFQTDGCQREYFVVPADKVVPIPDSISFEAGAMVEPTAVAVHALQRSNFIEGISLLVLGAGTIGLLILQVAKALGASKIGVADLIDMRLNLAGELGADHIIDVDREDLITRVKESFGPDGADLIVECVGKEDALEGAVKTARKGTRITVVGVIGGRPRISMGLVQDKELELVGSLMYMREDFEKSIELVKHGLIDPKQLITLKLGFTDLYRAYREADDRHRNVKVIVNMCNLGVYDS